MDDIENRRKRLIFRSWHRGTREMDLLMGSFADSFVPGMSVDELDIFEKLLKTSDPDVYDWVSGQKPVPANMMNPVLEKLLNHTYAKARASGFDSKS